MTMVAFKGRCHTCGHDHDAELQHWRDVLELTKTPQQRKPLSDKHIGALYESCLGPTGFGGHENNTPERLFDVRAFARAVERAHGITGETP